MIVTALACIMVSALLSLVFGEIFIAYWGKLVQSKVREHTPEGHQKKNNTPTMGGLFFLPAAAFAGLLDASAGDARYQVLLIGIAVFALIGFADDLFKIKKQQGVWARTKFIQQWLAALAVAGLLVFYGHLSTVVQIPCAGWAIDFGLWYVLWAAFVIVACANAVNLTDGLDGLATCAILPPLVLAALLAVGTGWASGFAAALCLAGSLLGFLWFNAHPARVFMGDVGALALGAALALMFLITKQELLIPLAGGVFLIEELSVMLQVLSYKLRRKRIFKMAPIHHHFELSGMPETKIVAIFSLISCLLSLAAFVLFRCGN